MSTGHKRQRFDKLEIVVYGLLTAALVLSILICFLLAKAKHLKVKRKRVLQLRGRSGKLQVVDANTSGKIAEIRTFKESE